MKILEYGVLAVMLVFVVSVVSFSMNGAMGFLEMGLSTADSLNWDV